MDHGSWIMDAWNTVKCCAHFNCVSRKIHARQVMFETQLNVAHILIVSRVKFMHRSWIMDHGSWIMDHGSWIMDLGYWILDLGSWIMDHGSWIMDHGSWIMDHGSWIVDHGSWIVDRGSWIVDRGSWIMDHGSWIMDMDHGSCMHRILFRARAIRSQG